MTNLPPGPKRLQLIPLLRASFLEPAPVLREVASTYGDTFRTNGPNGPITITGNPEAIRTLYTADPDTFGPYAVEVAEPIFGRSSLVVSSGAKHRRDRKLLTPPFNAGAMRAYGAPIAEAAAEAAQRVLPGQRFSMLGMTQEIALDVIIRVVFGVEGKERVEKMRAAVLKLIESLSPLIFIFPWTRRDFGGIGPWARFKRAIGAHDDLLLSEIQRRRAVAEERGDILSLMLRARYDDGSAMSDLELVEQLRGLLFAGHETTAVTLACAFHWLHHEPEVLGKLLSELDTLGEDADADAFASLPYLEAVCLEALRLNPPVVDTGRAAREPFDLLGYTIPAGEGMNPSPLLLHMRSDIYPEPERFRPERFLERKYSPFEYIPFGGGARRCLGAAFAMYEMKIALGTVLRKYRLRSVGSKRIAFVRRGLTLGPRGGVPMMMVE
ncbi:MAG TPA: cytochrome P450, partial [Polyangiaceae bacterium]|nr:cytochrome P450 [Polyangiaceae bacterium]